MFKLILHHTYKFQGEAVDISDYDNHGFRTEVPYVSDGIASGSGALHFETDASRVRVTNKAVWQHLRALKIEMWVKVKSLNPRPRMNLVEGHNSFAFFIQSNGVLTGHTYFPASHGTGATWDGANSRNHSPDQVMRTVPLDRWTKLTYVHDGVASNRLFIDDRLVAARYDLVSGVPSVGDLGIHIGQWPRGDRYAFAGEIDEVKIWKYDPEAAYKQFFGRPLTSEQMASLGHDFDLIAKALSDEHKGKLMVELMKCIGQAQEEMVRAVRSKGEGAIAQNREFSAEYRRLWRDGAIDGAAMESFLEAWLKWIAELLGPDYLKKYMGRVGDCWKESQGDQGVFGPLGEKLIEHDPAFVGYMKLMMKATGGS